MSMEVRSSYQDSYLGRLQSNQLQRTTTNTDKVDREIKRLKEERKQLEQQLASAGSEAKKKELEQKIAQIEKELSQKDNDTYRRQNAEVQTK